MSVCPVHGKTLKEGKFGEYCPTKLQDGSWCRYKPGRGLPQEQIPAPPVARDYINPGTALNPREAEEIAQHNARASQDAPRTQTKPEVDWDAVNRLSAAQTALNAAAQAYQGAGLEGETTMYQCFAMNYKLLMGCKIGGEVDQLIESIAHVQPREPEAF